MRKKIVPILIVLLLLMFGSVNFSFAQGELEVKYPEVGGETITYTTSLPGLVKYIFNLAVIISVIVAIGVLIFGGVLYLGSTGRPEILKSAKNWLVSGLLGLIILFGAYLILHTVNPQLTVLRIHRLPLTSGVVLLSDEAASKVGNPPDPSKLSEQISLGKAKKVMVISDFEKKFGEYDPVNDKFQFFTPKYLYIIKDFSGEPNTHTKVITFSDKNFQGEKKEYSEAINQCSSGLCPLEYFGSGLPPKSLIVKETGPGVYLYGDSPFEEFRVLSSISDFRTEKFNDKRLENNVKSITIKNRKGPGGEDLTDYLAILHEQVNYRGQCRIFFKKKERKVSQGNSNTLLVGNLEADAQTTTTATTTTANVQHVDEYGEIGSDLPSSINVFQLSDKWSGYVKICPAPRYEPEKDVNGNITKNCVVYTDPVWIPEDIEIKAQNQGIQKFNDSARSIEITGNFAVVLFENKPDGNGGWPRDGDHPGKCQVFVNSHPDLSSEPIGSCNAHSWIPIVGWFWTWAPCTSGIAIYPIK
jgi:hypothetical protein